MNPTVSDSSTFRFDGKSTPRMFATLDPTIRGVDLPSKRKVLLSDTVGFIRSLPHTLVSAFRATLEEVQRASLILHVSDASSRLSAEQDAQVEIVLKELEAEKKPRLRVMNKVDLLDVEVAEANRHAHPWTLGRCFEEQLAGQAVRLDTKCEITP